MSSDLDKALDILRRSFDGGNKLLLCGNGGSASDCEHIVGELMKGMENSRRIADLYPLQGALPAISLCSQVGLITAIVNDIGGDWIFAQQVWGYGLPGDVLMCISTSGNSANVINAMKVAEYRGMFVIGLTGLYTHEFDKYCDVILSAPGSSAAEIQEGHIKIYHELCKRLEEAYFT
jgi:D-sedoheptulose 7-phosphate isomerase